MVHRPRPSKTQTTRSPLYLLGTGRCHCLLSKLVSIRFPIGPRMRHFLDGLRSTSGAKRNKTRRQVLHIRFTLGAYRRLWICGKEKGTNKACSSRMKFSSQQQPADFDIDESAGLKMFISAQVSGNYKSRLPNKRARYVFANLHFENAQRTVRLHQTPALTALMNHPCILPNVKQKQPCGVLEKRCELFANGIYQYLPR
ncbi:hypothetical protein BDW02DRAFT_17688 [Decorospora gaudefroyi]|uniref:Uncharacterized protein n=1 Tax=Decorospora gaudefroyi TaxID=184978 RepID=A0A6A5K885_9PLEO|nr:hypothetical protein BDW02DRAFT_17688 [Decorospora gaudefroyi]